MASALDSMAPPRAGQSVAGYATYEEAQRTVDRLSDEGFPVEHVDIIGSDLHLVECVTGRLTSARAAWVGAGSGAWFGVFLGLLVGLFTTGPTWIGLLFGGLVIGAAWGALLGFFAHYATGGRRDFASERALIAGRYDVVVADAQARRARTLIGQVR